MKRRLLISGTSAILLCSLAFSLLSLPAGASGTTYGSPVVTASIIGNCNFPDITITISGLEQGDLNNAYYGGKSFTGFLTLPGGSNINNPDPTCVDIGDGLGDELGVSGGSTTASNYSDGEVNFSFNYSGVPSTGSGGSAVFPTITYTCDATNNSSGVQSWQVQKDYPFTGGSPMCESDNTYMNDVCSETFSSCGGVGATDAPYSLGSGISQSNVSPGPPGTYVEQGTGIPDGFCGANGQFPDGNCQVSGEEYGSGSFISEWGVNAFPNFPGPNGQCDELSQPTGFTSATGDGSRAFPFTLSYSGAASVIAADPMDGDTNTVSRDGMTFSADTVFDTSPSSPDTLDVVVADGGNPNLTHFYCYADGVWYDWGLDSSGGEAGPLGPGCDITGINVKGPTSAGLWTYLMIDDNSGETGALAVDYADSSTPTYTLLGKTFAANDPNVEDPGVAVTIHGSAANNTYNSELWCYSLVDSAWHDLGQIAQGTTSVGSSAGSTGCFNLSAALDNSGMTLTDPISWVTGLAIDTVAVIKWAFVPCAFQIDSLYQPITTHVPFMWISDAVSAGTTLQNAVITGESSGVCSGPGISPFTGATLKHVGSLSALHSWSIVLPGPASLGCTQPGSDSAGDLFGYRSLIRGVWALILWLGVLRMAWKMLPWAAANDGIQILTGPSDGGGEGITDQMIEDSANNPGSYGSGSDHYPAP